MARYIDAELFMQKLSRMIDYCEKNKDKKFNALNVLFQVGDAIMDCPDADVVPKSEVDRLEKEVERLQKYNADIAFKHYNDGKTEIASKIFEEIESMLVRYTFEDGYGEYISTDLEDEFAELKKKYTENGK